MIVFAHIVLAAFTLLVPEDGISKAFTLRGDDEAEYTVRFYRPDVFRVEAAPKVWTGEGTNRTCTVDYADPSNDPHFAQMVVKGYTEDKTGVSFEDKDGKFTFRTSALQVSFYKDTKKMNVWDYRGRLLLEDAGITLSTNGTELAVKSAPDVRYYGGGQQVGSIQHKGQKLLIDCDCNWSEGGVPNPQPFLMSSQGFGVFRHTFAAGSYDLTGDDYARLVHDENRFDGFFFFGDYAHILDRYTEMTGRPNLIPMWGLELGDADAYMTRDEKTKLPKQNEKGEFIETTPVVVDRVAKKYREADMPGGWLLVNDGYGCGHIQLASVIDKLAQLHFHTGLWTEGALKRLKWESGYAGTRIQKLDVAWTGTPRENCSRLQHPLQCQDEAFRGITENSEARAFIWSVFGWAGSQRYAIAWAGDEYGGWDLIRYMIPTVPGTSMSGWPYVTADVDGIFGGSNETYLRDLQWKCWTTAMMVMNGWSHMNKGPWSYPEPYRSLIREALYDKIRLTPFLYTLMRQAYEKGTPVNRPMVWNYPDDPETFGEQTKYQFMVGDSVLVAPVYTAEKVNRGWWRKGIYLPAGDWYDYNDGRRVTGGQWLKAYPIDLTRIPVFVKAGGILPMYPKAITTSGSDKRTLTFDVWPKTEMLPAATSSFEVYEDDGETQAYAKKDEWTKQKLTVTAPTTPFDRIGDMTLDLGAVRGKGFKGMCKDRTYEFLVHTQAKPIAVRKCEVPGAWCEEEILDLNTTNNVTTLYANAKAGWYYDPEEKLGTVHVKYRGAPATLELRFAASVVTRAASPAYPVPTAAEDEAATAAMVCKAVDMPIVNNTNVNRFTVGDDLVVTNNTRVIIDHLDGTYRRLTGHVASHPDNDAAARYTFTIKCGGDTIFERANMKGKDVPQLIAVDIPADKCDWLVFDFKADDDSVASKSAKGIWQKVEFRTEE